MLLHQLKIAHFPLFMIPLPGSQNDDDDEVKKMKFWDDPEASYSQWKPIIRDYLQSLAATVQPTLSWSATSIL